MQLRIEIPDAVGAALKAQAEARGVPLDRLAAQLLAKTLEVETGDSGNGGKPPLETGYGMWAKYGPAPSADEIDENRPEMFRNFAQDD
jgi:hypothetical protein